MNTNLDQTLERIAAQFSPVALASSLSVEDMVLTDAIAHAGLPSRFSCSTPGGCTPTPWP